MLLSDQLNQRLQASHPKRAAAMVVFGTCNKEDRHGGGVLILDGWLIVEVVVVVDLLLRSMRFMDVVVIVERALQ